MSTFAKKIIHWSQQHGRHDLPWQIKRNPYLVWVSEVMLQQTQVSTVIPYFQKFIRRFPNVKALAQGDIEDVLSLWSGLGYYSRARNLHHAANQVLEHFNGKIPSTQHELMQLKGIGRSTAGAILSLGFHLPFAILDGNVKRILCRTHEIEGWYGRSNVEKQLWTLSEQYVPRQHVADYTQGIMDLGATVCTPKNPACTACPLKQNCASFKNKTTAHYPSPKPKKDKPQKTAKCIIFASPQQQLFLEKRPNQGIWGGLWSFPEYTGTYQTMTDWCLSHYGLKVKSIKRLAKIKHEFTHFTFLMSPVLCQLEHVPSSSKGQWFSQAQAMQKGIPAPIKKIIQHFLPNSVKTHQEVIL